MSGSAFAQALAFALSPVISRLFSPGDFGVFGSFNAVLMVITAGVTLDYSQAIMLPKEKSDAINLFAVSCLSTVLIAIGCLIVWLLVPLLFQELIKTSKSWLAGWLVLAVLVGGLNQSFQAWCVRVKAFKRTSSSQAVRGVAAAGMQVGLGCLKTGATGLVISGIMADLIASINLLWSVVPDYLANRSAVRWQRMKQLALEYRDFPTYSASQNVVNSLSSGLPVLLLGHYFGLAVAGAYAFGMVILGKPTVLILNALRPVLFQKAGETQHCGGRLTPLYVKTTAGLFAIALLPCLVLLLGAPQLFVWVFGVQWHTAGEFARLLVLWTLLAFCNLPAVLFARLVRIQRLVFFYDLVLLTVRTAALVLGGLYLTASQTVCWYAITGAIMNFILILLVGYAVQKKDYRNVISIDHNELAALPSSNNTEQI